MQTTALTLKTIFTSIVSLCLLMPSISFAQNQTAHTYRYTQHHNFQIFYQDFQHALKQQDKEAVLKMTQMPFMCHAIECGALNEYKNLAADQEDLSLRNKKEFMKKYDRVFTPRMADFLKPRFVKLSDFDPEDANVTQFYSPTEYVLQSFYTDAENRDADVFSFDLNEQGQYRLQHIPYRP